jgi:hypothetical protein
VQYVYPVDMDNTEATQQEYNTKGDQYRAWYNFIVSHDGSFL